MPFLMGMDEAGYGPNLGPLVVSATVWQVPDLVQFADLYHWLDSVVTRNPMELGRPHPIVIADSKVMYKSRGRLRPLEHGVLICMALVGEFPRSWRQLHRALVASHRLSSPPPWHVDFDCPLPRDACALRIADDVRAIEEKLSASRISLVRMRSEVIQPERFNSLVGTFGNKSLVLSKISLGLAKDVLAEIETDSALVVCDKHGGRNSYAKLLQDEFPDYLVEVHGEGRAESVYQTGPRSRRVEFRFQMKGESFLPSALASMISKYLRELDMLALNSYWARHVRGLKPTAGYPSDAKRFKNDIAQAQADLGIPDAILWRSR